MKLIERAKFLEVDARVRYWEDTEVNGIEDEFGSLICHRSGDSWVPIISLEGGKILNWPKNDTAKIHYKVCDDGDYWLLDSNKKRIAKWISYYVPNEFLTHGDNGHGDYIIMDIDSDGSIIKYRVPTIIDEEWAQDI